MRSIPAVIFLLVMTVSGKAQTLKSDAELLSGRSFGSEAAFAQYQGPGNSAAAPVTRRQSWIARYNPVSLALKGALFGYQRLMSQQLARSCPYEITCSNFSKQAIYQFGMVKGVFLSADRIMRCNRIGLLDVHPLSINDRTGAIIDSPAQYRLR